MIWKRNLELLAATLPTLNAPSPWTVASDENNNRTILDGNQNPIFVLKAPPESPEDQGEFIQTWTLLSVICSLRNECELWFDEMIKAEISDIVLPKKPKAPTVNNKKEPRPVPEPRTFNVKEGLRR